MPDTNNSKWLISAAHFYKDCGPWPDFALNELDSELINRIKALRDAVTLNNALQIEASYSRTGWVKGDDYDLHGDILVVRPYSFNFAAWELEAGGFNIESEYLGFDQLEKFLASDERVLFQADDGAELAEMAGPMLAKLGIAVPA